MRRRFFVETFEEDAATLRGDTARHLTTVLRAEAGQRFELSDGMQLWLGEILEAGRDTVTFSLIERLPECESKLRIDLLLAIVKFDRFEWAIEKATELGVSEIIPVAAARSDKGLIAAAPKRAARWQKILFESAQQSRRLSPPQLRAALKSPEVFAMAHNENAIRLLLSEEAAAPRLQIVLSRDEGASASHLSNDTRTDSPVQHVFLAVGPEGGWTPEEVMSARDANFASASLGPLILRTETAVAAALASINYALGA